MRRHLGWPAGPIVARSHASGTALAFAAPEDQLYAATEVNEWAWQRALEQTSGALYPRPLAPAHPAVWDEAAAAATLLALAAAEANPGLMVLLREGRRLGLPVLLDDATLTLGAGVRHRSWTMAALPTVEAVPWKGLRGIPIALVTGSNGKTTSVRLLAAMAAAQGWTTGHTCTDGIHVGGELLEAGDYSGPGGARAVLRNARVEAAILETARGGILRRGLAVDRAAVALVTNVTPDHFGEYGIHSVEELADAKLVVARALGPEGLLVLNADDAMLATRGTGLACGLGWFALDDGHPRLAAHRTSGGATCGARLGRLRLHWQGVDHDLGAVAALPLSAGGTAAYNVSNLAGAALAAAGLGIDPLVIGAVLATFGSLRSDNPGRLERWQFGGITVFMDYAHNPEGLEGLLKVATAGRGTGRLGLLLGQAGNRGDAAIQELAGSAARFQPDLVVLKDLEGFMRGRAPGEVPSILRAELLRLGQPVDSMRTVLPEAEGARELLEWARPGDTVVLPVHGPAARVRLEADLDARAERVAET
ncbi:MAG: Mur ligase [Holophagaceae bacterium]|nr:Mur ligase [Holophagaceae bacterium]